MSLWIPEPIRSTHGHSCWRTIAAQAQKVAHLFRIKLNSGAKTSFWVDLWGANQTEPLKNIAPNLFRISTKKAGQVKDFVILDTPGSWNIEFSRDIRNTEIPSLARLLAVIGDNPPQLNDQSDFCSWSLTNKGIFTVKSLYDYLSGSSSTGYPTKLIWNPKIPFKINFFFWLASLHKLLTLDNLKKRGHHIANGCYFCLQQEETTPHLLLHCSFTQRIWDEILPRFGWCWACPGSVISLAHSWSSHGFSKTGKLLWQFVPASIFWVIWLERNRRIFDNKSKDPIALSHEVKSLIHFWVSSHYRDLKIPLHSFIFN
ncbi:Reverse transcriptase zinc-binding domain [Macleaya cordata]|nr:Reverse transcriptase zinc-binding domain [Macleaya cordata]